MTRPAMADAGAKGCFLLCTRRRLQRRPQRAAGRQQAGSVARGHVDGVQVRPGPCRVRDDGARVRVSGAE